jgi:tetratricopeptide (TPR) repeat protein
MGSAYRFLGLVKMGQGKLTDAQLLLRKSLETFGDYIVGWDIAQSYCFLGEAAFLSGDPVESREIFMEALRLAEGAKSVPLMLSALASLAWFDTRTGAHERALEVASLLTTHYASTQETKDPGWQILAELENILNEKINPKNKGIAPNHFLEAVTELYLQ